MARDGAGGQWPMVVLFSIAGCGFCVGFLWLGGVDGTTPFPSALRSSSRLLCLYVNLRLSAALYAKIENTKYQLTISRRHHSLPQPLVELCCFEVVYA